MSPPGIKKAKSVCQLPPLEYTLDYDAEAMVKGLEGRKNCASGCWALGCPRLAL
jgi:hypothetical protein